MLIQAGPSSLHWFHRWLHLLKSLNRVLRDHKEHLTEDLARNGLAGAATLVAQSSHPFFASWRWHTLADCCASIGKVLPTLKLIVLLLVFLSRARDKSLHEKALEAIRDAKWESMLRCVGPLDAWVVKLQKWVTGCECHRSELEQGKHVDCWQNGRLLHLAYDHAMKYLQDSVAEAGTWIRASLVAIKTCWRRLSACTVGHWPQPRRESALWMWCRGFSPDSTTMVCVLASFNNGSRHLLLDTMPSRDSSSRLERICGGRSMTWLEATWLHA